MGLVRLVRSEELFHQNALLLSSDRRVFAVDWCPVVKSQAELVLLIALLVLAALSVVATLK
jgi:hypothetical protein